MISALYQIVITPLSLFATVAAICTRRGRIGILERCGFWNLPSDDYLWLHGASVGEINGLIPLVPSLRDKFPGVKILITAVTATGRERAREFADAVAILPWDNSISLKYALRRVRLRGFVFGETELWPGLLALLHARGVPVFWVNARISDYTARSYRALRWLLRPSVRKMIAVLGGDAKSCERAIDLGAISDRVKFVGNAKYDRRALRPEPDESEELKQRLFSNPGAVLTLACLRPGEEQWWFNAIVSEHSLWSKLNLVVAPRHAERFDYFAEQLSKYKIPFRRWSELDRSIDNTGHQVVLLDMMGVLESIYSISDLAFIGGSLVDEGGHNPLEAAMYGVCIAMGPHQTNVRDLTARFKSTNAIFQIKDEGDVRRIVALLAAGDPQLAASGERARILAGEFAGIAARVVEEIEMLAVGAKPKTIVQSCIALASHPLAIIYGLVTRIRNRLYDSHVFASAKVELPVISVGNLTVGGNSKTPMCHWLVQELKAAGHNPVVLSRGYGASTAGPHQVRASDSAALVGDEPLLTARATHQPVVIARDRLAGARFIVEHKLGDIVVLDDGMQHRRLGRDCEILMIESGSANSFGEFNRGAILPQGRFRENRETGLRRVGIAVLAARQGESETTRANSKLLRKVLPSAIAVFESSLKLQAVSALGSTEKLEPCPCIALCAIANPEGFFATLRQAGFTLYERIALRDHSPISSEFLARIRTQSPGVPIVCTEKDAVKIDACDHLGVYAAHVSLAVVNSEALLAAIGACVGGRVKEGGSVMNASMSD